MEGKELFLQEHVLNTIGRLTVVALKIARLFVPIVCMEKVRIQNYHATITHALHVNTPIDELDLEVNP